MRTTTFRGSSARLLDLVRSMIRRGEITERGLAKLMGYSQPHVHNVLAGVRGVNMGFADDLMEALGLPWSDLHEKADAHDSGGRVRVPLRAGSLSEKAKFPRKSDTAGAVFLPSGFIPQSSALQVMKVGEDEAAMWPTIWPGDLIVLDISPQRRVDPDVDGVYALKVRGKGMLRRCRKLGDRLLAVAENEDGEGNRWISLEGRRILDIVRGRVIWLGRGLEV